MRLLTTSLLAIALFASCNKEDEMRRSHSGLYKVVSQERHWPQADSTVTISEMGTLGLYDNANSIYNNVVLTLVDWPLSWANNRVGGDQHDQLIGWYSDDVDGSTITFFSNPDPAFFDYVVYTVEKTGRRTFNWTYVETDQSGAMSYREVWKVERE